MTTWIETPSASQAHESLGPTLESRRRLHSFDVKQGGEVMLVYGVYIESWMIHIALVIKFGAFNILIFNSESMVMETNV